jgi:hypothetical protein
MEWILAGLLVAGVTVYFWRQNRQLRKSNASGADAASVPATKPVTPQYNLGNDPTNAPQMPGTKPATSSVDLRGRQSFPQGSQPGELPDRQPIPGMASGAYVPAPPPTDALSEARLHFELGDSKAFYRELNRAVWKALNRKTDLPASELNKSNAVRMLRLRGWDETSLLSLENILNECEMNLYTPAYDRYNMEQLLNQTQRLLDRLA